MVILRTTRRRLDALCKPVMEREIYGLMLELGEATGGDRPMCRVEVEMPYSAGIALRDLMIDHCYTDRKTMRRGLSSSEHGALKDVTTATNEEARHPALRGVGMEGHEARVFHVWGVGEKRWSPWPIPGIQFKILKPTWHVDEDFPSMKFTFWDEREGPPYSRLDDEALHWRFVRDRLP